MTWKIKIINIVTKKNEFNNIFIYYILFKQNPQTSKFEEFYKSQESILAKDIKSKNKNQKEQFVKDFVKTTIQPLIDVFENQLDLEDIIGYEEII